MSDADMFSVLQTELERMKERAKAVRKRIAPVRKRLQKRMEEEELSELRCGNFVLEMDNDSSTSDGDNEDAAIFTKDRVRAHFGDEQYEDYCANNQRPKRKKRKVVCRRDVVDVDAQSDADVDVVSE